MKISGKEKVKDYDILISPFFSHILNLLIPFIMPHFDDLFLILLLVGKYMERCDLMLINSKRRLA